MTHSLFYILAPTVEVGVSFYRHLPIKTPCAIRMTPIETTQKMLAELKLSDKELEEVRDICDMLAEVVVDDWFEKRKEKKHGRA